MNPPVPDAAFDWRREPWGLALRCRALDDSAQHLFTSRQLALPDAESWRVATASLGATPDRLMRVKQVHGNSVRVLQRGAVPADASQQRPDADAIASNQAGLVVAVTVAEHPTGGPDFDRGTRGPDTERLLREFLSFLREHLQ